ncbi:hypothetical protein U9M48_017335 [Paspalum notatum var. saurae]|uniref:Uncharacterized protein n=1 Tax=Paspalum notatum var. saurae TaxID=547442 RepID=A0AAQ3T989_PASNO
MGTWRRLRNRSSRRPRGPRPMHPAERGFRKAI